MTEAFEKWIESNRLYQMETPNSQIGYWLASFVKECRVKGFEELVKEFNLEDQ